MKRLTLIVIVLALAVAFSGCSTFKAMDGSSQREMEAFEEGKPVVAKTAGFKPVEIPSMKPKPITGLTVIEREPEPVMVAEEPEPEPVMVAEVSEPEPIEECPACPPCEEVARSPLSEIKIKVLNGNGKSGSAKRMKGKLKKMGYVIERIDNAPRKTFTRNTVFYADCCKAEAEDLAEKLGGKTIIKRLSWHSIFDIIVVTGKK
jgi:hypothetical protein